MDVNTHDRDVYAAIRPEGFVVDEDGPMTCTLERVEVMGRDTSILSKNPAFDGTVIRSNVSSEDAPDSDKDTVHFSLKPGKVHLFDIESEERIDF